MVSSRLGSAVRGRRSRVVWGRLSPASSERDRPGQQAILRGVEPGDPGVAAEPGLLAAGEALGRLHGFLAGLVQRPVTVQITEHLLIAEGAAGGPAVAQALA